MRDILFRGKRLDNGEWIAGCLVKYAYNSTPYIGYLDAWGDGIYKVDPSTVGQFTGLCDKNGVRIFEGDICQVGHLLYKVEFAFSQWKFTILSNRVYCYPAFNSHCDERCIIIGNIHDNPELLEDEG